MHKNSGATLMEVLISLILLSILLLGIDAVQVISLQKSKINYYVAAAEQQIISMMERMKITKDAEIWNQQNMEMLPQGRGVITEKAVSIFWGSGNGENCESNQIKKDGCIRYNFN